jgi:predicted PurR-regulated permease PerM
MSERNSTEIHISVRTILKIALIILAAWLFYFFRDLVVVLITSFVLAVVIDPLADLFERHKLPRFLAVLLVYIVLLSILSLIFSLIIPPIFVEIKDVLGDVLNYWEKFSSGYTVLQSIEMKEILGNLESTIGTLEAGVSKIAGSAYGVATGIFGNLFDFVLILVLALYMVIYEEGLKDFVRSLVPQDKLLLVDKCAVELRSKLGSWLKGQLILCVTIWFAVYVGLLIIGVPYALVLSLLAGLLEAIPYMAVLAAFPAVFMALTISPWKAVFVAALFFVVQELENNLLVPKVMQKAVGLNPIVIVLALVIGGKLAGILGVILAIPVALSIKILLDVIWFKKGAYKEAAVE